MYNFNNRLMGSIMIILYILICIEILGIIPILLIWNKDCREIGIENLAVQLKDRIFAYIAVIIIPSLVGIFWVR